MNGCSANDVFVFGPGFGNDGIKGLNAVQRWPGSHLTFLRSELRAAISQ
jgi:hypothetical protein